MNQGLPSSPRPGVPRTSFVGREAQLESLHTLLSEAPLVTLTGPGGTGKTRLALEAARRRPPVFPEEPWWVDLAPLGSGDLVAGAVAAAIGLPNRTAAGIEDEIVGSIGDRTQLMLLDNCEHLVEACASLCETLITRCPGLCVLATSRIPLRVPGERVLAVPTLNIEQEAVALFVDRAHAANAGFAIDSANRPDVQAVCSRLDGIPLAIELAASWVAVMSPSELLPLLDRRFEVLTGGSRTASERQRTLWSAIDWSHQLLSPAEQTLFRRLCVFAGSFTREAAEQVCADDSLPAPSILNNLAGLCTASMVVPGAQPAGETRYRLLESLRAYGQARLDETSERAGLQTRHLRYFTAVAEKVFLERMHGGLISVVDALSADRDNVRAALDWGAGSDPEDALGLAATLVEDLRQSLLPFGEMGERLRDLLDRTARGTPRYAWALIAGGYTAFAAGADEEALTRFRASIELFGELGDRCGEAWARLALGHVYWAAGDLPGASRELRLSKAIHESMGNRLGRHRARMRIGVAEALLPERQAAIRDELQESILEGVELGDSFGAGMAHNWLGMIDLTSGDIPSARRHFHEGISFLAHDSLVAVAFFGLAVCCLQNDPERSLRLIGAGEILQPRSGLPKPVFLAQIVDRYQPVAVQRVGEQAAARALEEGKAMTRDEAIALAQVDDLPASKGRSAAPGGLTAREEEVAHLVSEGLTNREIADSLVLSVRTVETHVDRILTKLGFHNRARLAAWIKEQDR